MKPSIKFRLVVLALLASLALNGAILGYLANSGGLRRIFLKMDLVSLPETRAEFAKALEAKYRKYPDTAGEIVFAGDSLVADAPWAEFYSDIRQRGIGGETVQSMLGRIDEVTSSHPKKLFLLLGTNDLRAAVPPAQFLRTYRELLGRIREQSPETAVHVIGILPHHDVIPVPRPFGTYPPPPYDNAYVADVNRQLKDLVAEFPRVKFIDLTPYVADKDGVLRRDFSVDGCHLNVEGYLAIREPMKDYVAADRPTRPAGKSD